MKFRWRESVAPWDCVAPSCRLLYFAAMLYRFPPAPARGGTGNETGNADQCR